MKTFSRRGFVAGTTRASAALLALIAGVVPELSNAAMSTTTPTTPGTGDDPPPAMESSAQSALYSQALNDTDVLLLISTCSEQGRLDPPSSSVDFALDTTGQGGKQVFLPVRSYASGQTLAYVIYGPGKGIGPDGSLQTSFVKSIVGNTGKFNFAARGALYPAPAPEVALALFMYLFPSEYSAQAASLTVSTAAQSLQKRFFRKVAQAKQIGADPVLSDCLFKAGYTYDACMKKTQAALAAVLVGCLLLLLCLGVITLLSPAGGLALSYSCMVFGGATLAAILAAIAQAKACAAAYTNGVGNCHDPVPA